MRITPKVLKDHLSDPGKILGDAKRKEVQEGPLEVRLGRKSISFRGHGVLFGERVRIPIGKFVASGGVDSLPDTPSRTTPLTLSMARRYAAQIKVLCAEGNDPRAPKVQRAPETIETLEALVDAYVERRLPDLRQPNEVLRLLRRIPARLLNQHPDAVSTGEVEDFLNSELNRIRRKGGKGSAVVNRQKSAISAVYTWARRRRLCSTHPARGIPARKIYAEKRVLSAPEIWAVWHACAEHWAKYGKHLAGPFLLLRLLTGAREYDLTERTWSDLRKGPTDDSPAATLTDNTAWLHVDVTKTGAPHRVFLPPISMGVVRELWKARSGKDIFPGPKRRRGSKPRRSGNLREEDVRQVRELAGLATHWRPGDLRKTAASGMVELGVPEGTVAQCLRHLSASPAPTVTRNHYIASAAYYAKMRPAWELWGACVESIVNQESPPPVAVDHAVIHDFAAAGPPESLAALKSAKSP